MVKYKIEIYEWQIIYFWLLKKTVELIAAKGYQIGNIDATICAERPKLKAHIPSMQQVLAEVMGIDADDISIKATTTEKLGFTGREEGISAYATVLINRVWWSFMAKADLYDVVYCIGEYGQIFLLNL